MPGGNEFNKIGEYGEITKEDRDHPCDSCGNTISKQEKYFDIEVDPPEDCSQVFSMNISICKNCVRLAARRMGLLR